MNSNSTDSKTIRKFGLIALIFFGCLSILGIHKEKLLPFYLFGLLSAMGLGFLIIPNVLKPVYVSWLKIAHFISKVFTAFFLVFFYYFVITPFAVIIRLFGKALLPVEPDQGTSTYWVTRAEPAQPKERYVKRY